jgi:hypothetical protein
MKTYTQDLIKLPTQIFEQGRLGEEGFESPIQFQAFTDVIGLQQEDTSIIIHPDAVEQFIKALRQFKKECYK